MRKIKDNLDPPKILVLGFAIIILIGATLLTLPIATEDGQGLSFLNALFTATSATCVTGLIVVDTGDTFSMFGELVILSLIQVGGLGFMTFATLLFILLGKKISFKERLLLKEAFNNITFAGMVRLVKRILIFTAIIEFVGGSILAIRFSFDMPAAKAIYYGFFHSISNFNNAGFDLMGEFRSLTPYVDDPTVVLTVCSLITLGGLGFVVLNELFEYRQTRQLSVHTKAVLTTTLILTIGATVLIFLFEYGNNKTIGPLSVAGKSLGALFHAVTPRTAGANTLPMADLTHSTLFLTIILMYIGAGSGSTAGGIKITTFAVLMATVWSQFKGKEDVVLFKRRIVMETILKAFTVATSGALIVMIVTILLSITEKGHVFLMYLFEAASAFGTVGLSMGLTPELSPIGRLLIILTMFTGRLGPLTLAYAITKRQKQEAYHHPKGNIMIG
ncbi:potassium uptake protein, TrkH family [Schinkia azotoformans MEV2011]|uniref:Potassium uptake protein, TrkH family n=1 Tax=Schinkia azotoformans MEV2011 TaxID=1348973 RepID=A0A072NRD1_SCHAZ|nr:TrkH family potassium uptake protein [Schinkia azotoformans]KEF40229.1 potassium uptake protein, TrkH family [Schinkia azotoformans MEV2011]MEC1696461.1 TrkH family potassium uptake protein [Schinkia azotoformans]MEC1715152.1 TrkH family potassium uptake protein [Schinkia azotoformans]MEC1724132.1 TrkH family potassium uptake protein [Schinkia azotoformans]MEC1739798.1 TrkH family potassium uptake protein [Schinkia azotoformans]